MTKPGGFFTDCKTQTNVKIFSSLGSFHMAQDCMGSCHKICGNWLWAERGGISAEKAKADYSRILRQDIKFEGIKIYICPKVERVFVTLYFSQKFGTLWQYMLITIREE